MNITTNTEILIMKKAEQKWENHEITLIRTNPGHPNFDIKNLIVQIRIRIKEVTKKQTKDSLIDDLSKTLL